MAKEFLVIDAHCDAPSQMLRLRDYCKDNDVAQVDFPKMKRGGVGASFFALYIPAALQGESAYRYALRLHNALAAQMQSAAPVAASTPDADAIVSAHKAGKIAVLTSLENASPLGEDLARLEEFYNLGVRAITLTHSADNQVCDSCTGKGSWGGLSPFGRELVKAMNERGMLIDLAHCSDNTMADVLALSSKPVAYTHGCCRALCSHRRNISDEMLRGIAENGGVACMSIYPLFLEDDASRVLAASGLEEQMWIEDEFIKDPSSEQKRRAWEELQGKLNALPRPSVEKVADHIEHAVAVAGIDHVGIGTDYDGIELTADGLENISKFALIFDVLKRRGFSDEDCEKIASGNLLRVLRNC